MSSQEYDITLKSLNAEGGPDVLNALAGGGRVEEWLNVELPRVRNPRVDLLARMTSGRLAHIELDSSNDITPERMLEYLSGIWARMGKVPRQIVIYVGNRPLRIRPGHKEEGLSLRYEVIDFRELDGEAMLRSESIAVNILSILAALNKPEEAVRRIMMRIARLEQPEQRADALRKLFILAGVRSLASRVEEERNKMPITMDIMEHDVLGPKIRKAQLEGEAHFARLQLEKRFGPLPEWAEERLGKCTVEEMDRIAVRILEVESLEQLFA